MATKKAVSKKKASRSIAMMDCPFCKKHVVKNYHYAICLTVRAAFDKSLIIAGGMEVSNWKQEQHLDSKD